MGKPRRSHRHRDEIGSGIEHGPGGPLTAGNSGSPSPSLSSSVSRSRSNTAAMAALPRRTPRRVRGRAVTDSRARDSRYHSATAAARADTQEVSSSVEPAA